MTPTRLSPLRRSGWAGLLTFILGSAAGCAGDTPVRDAAVEDVPYTTEKVSYASNDTKLSGVLWLPLRPGPHPALVLVDGSGRTTANKWRPWMKMLAEWGFACLSYDKRGVGDSEGIFLGGLNIDIRLLASDVVAGVNYMKGRDEIDGSRIGLLGVSQAGWVIPVAATESRDVSFTVIFSGTTVSVGEENYYSQLTGDDPFWKFIYWNLSRDEISRRLAAEGPSMFDPLPYLKRMTAPGLWLFGELDTSQPTRESVMILDKLIKDQDKAFTYRVFRGADHSLWVDGALAEGVFETQKDWLLKQTSRP